MGSPSESSSSPACPGRLDPASNKRQGWALNRALVYGFDSAAALGPCWWNGPPTRLGATS